MFICLIALVTSATNEWIVRKTFTIGITYSIQMDTRNIRSKNQCDSHIHTVVPIIYEQGIVVRGEEIVTYIHDEVY